MVKIHDFFVANLFRIEILSLSLSLSFFFFWGGGGGVNISLKDNSVATDVIYVKIK